MDARRYPLKDGAETFLRPFTWQPPTREAARLTAHAQEAQEHFARALSLRRTARTYQAEYPTDDGAFYFWQFAEHIREVMS